MKKGGSLLKLAINIKANSRKSLQVNPHKFKAMWSL